LFEPALIIRDIPWDLVVKIEENRSLLPGVIITVEPLRYYPGGSLAGHVLGYIHSIDQNELEQSEGLYDINSLIGKAGIEKSYEQELRGTDGARRVEVDALGRPIPAEDLVTLEPIPGNNLILTLDYDLQKVMEKSMEDTLNQLQIRHPKAKVGSAVVLNVKTGEVLAATSYPVMYPDDWKGNISNQRVPYYFPQGDTYNPMEPGAAINRAIQTTYPPGSTFKPITGMAALDKGLVDALADFVNCKGGYWIPPNIKCWNVHGNVNYYAAMAGSCNTYFQEAGRRAGHTEIIRVSREFGLGERTGIDLPNENKGLLPTPEWKKEINEILINRKYERLRQEVEERYKDLIANAVDEKEREKYETAKKREKFQIEANYRNEYSFNTTWQPYDTFNMSIGQGSNDYTVLQLANYTAAIANGGLVMKPYLVSKIVSPEGELIAQSKPVVIRRVDVSPQAISETKRAMQAVTQPGGTAHFLFYHFPENIGVAAKTGTAQTGRKGDNPLKDYHGVFIAFAPVDDPEIAFAGVIEYGYSGGESAGLVARTVFEQYFGIKDHLNQESEEDNHVESIDE
jgi:penicillin-binding protein 2